MTPPTTTMAPSSIVGRSSDRVLDLAPQRRLDAEQRMIGHVQPEHLLLEAQLLGLVELEVGDRGALVEPVADVAGVAAVVAPVAEQAHHALLALAAALDAWCR